MFHILTPVGFFVKRIPREEFAAMFVVFHISQSLALIAIVCASGEERRKVNASRIR